MKKTKEILIIAYYFPPMGMGGVQRAVKLAKYLSRIGWNISVLTVKDVLYHDYDYTLLDELNDVEIFRSGSLDPLRIARIFNIKRKSTKTARKKKTGSKNLIPDNKLLWIPFAFNKGGRIIKKKNIQAIISTAPPFSSHLLAMLLGQKFGIPWIADFRDGWKNRKHTDNIENISGTEYSHERRIVESADEITVVSDTHNRNMKIKYPEFEDRFNLIYNGFDHEDFPEEVEVSDKFNITYCGTAADVIDPSVFLPFFENAIKEKPELSEFLRINFVGKILDNDIFNRINEFTFSDCIVLKGYLDHKSAIKELMQSDMLLFPVTGDAGGGIVTSKIFEYLYTDKPIIANIPDDEEKQILEKSNRIVYLVNEGKGEEFLEYLFFHYTDWKKKKVSRKDYIQKSSISKQD
ncbi:MAG: glycosyltransferase family 4 protein, partial [bacterium]|nr:glycosyltransferase family 4 protein [bacterium]